MPSQSMRIRPGTEPLFDNATALVGMPSAASTARAHHHDDRRHSQETGAKPRFRHRQPGRHVMWATDVGHVEVIVREGKR